ASRTPRQGRHGRRRPQVWGRRQMLPPVQRMRRPGPRQTFFAPRRLFRLGGSAEERGRTEPGFPADGGRRPPSAPRRARPHPRPGKEGETRPVRRIRRGATLGVLRALGAAGARGGDVTWHAVPRAPAPVVAAASPSPAAAPQPAPAATLGRPVALAAPAAAAGPPPRGPRPRGRPSPPPPPR